MKISDFAREKQVEAQAVAKYIKRHPELFEKHVTMQDGHYDLDPAAVEILSKKYKSPIVQTIEDTETKEKLLRLHEKHQAAQELIIELQRQLQEQTAALADARKDILQIEQKEEERKAALDRAEKAESEKKEALDRILIAEKEKEDAEKKAAEAAAEVERLLNRSLWERIRNK